MSPQAPPTIFSYAKLARKFARIDALAPASNPIWQMICDGLHERMQEITHQFEKAICLTPFESPLITQLQSCENLQHLQPIILSHLANEKALNLDELHIFDIKHSNANALIVPMILSTVNDLTGLLIQMNRALQADGLLLANLAGGETLKELRHVLAETETALTGGIRPRVHPFIDIRDAGNLLQRAGFNLPVIDRDIITITYPDIFALMHDLRMLGATNIQQNAAQHFTGKTFFAHANECYKSLFSNEDGTINVTLELLNVTAWKPAETQPKPLARGSGKVSLKTVLE